MLALAAIVDERGCKALLGASRLTTRVAPYLPSTSTSYADRWPTSPIRPRAAWRGPRDRLTRSARATRTYGAHDLYTSARTGPRAVSSSTGTSPRVGADHTKPSVNAPWCRVVARVRWLPHCSAGSTAAFTVKTCPASGSALENVAGDRRMIGRVLLESSSKRETRKRSAGFEKTRRPYRLDPGAEPLGRVVEGFGNDGESADEGCRPRKRGWHLLHASRCCS